MRRAKSAYRRLAYHNDDLWESGSMEPLGSIAIGEKKPVPKIGFACIQQGRKQKARRAK